MRGGRVVTYQDSTTKAYERALAVYVRQYAPKRPISGPVSIRACFVHSRPKRLMQKTIKGEPVPPGLMYKQTAPDLDNCFKALADGLQIAGFFNNDAQVCAIGAFDYYAERDAEARIVVAISELGPGAVQQLTPSGDPGARDP